MFKPVPMVRLSAAILERDRRVVLRSLGELEAMEMTCLEVGPDTAPVAPRDQTGNLARCNQLLNRIAEIRKSLEIESTENPVVQKALTQQEISLDAAEERLGCIDQQTAVLIKRRQELSNRRAKLETLHQQIETYCGLEIPLDQTDRFSFLHFVVGNLPPGNFEELQGLTGVALLPLPEKNGRQPLIAMTTRAGRQGLETALQKADFHRESFSPAEAMTPDSLSETTSNEKEEVLSELERISEEIGKLAAEAGQPLAEMESSLTTERLLLEAEQNFVRTERSVLLSGWIPAPELPELKQRLNEITANRCSVETSPAEEFSEEQVPVLLRHSRFLRPFGSLVAAYGLPSYQELEPTLFVAISYLLMFGMMFGDVGQGAVLAAAGAALLASRREKLSDAGLLLLFGGLSSMMFGVIYGSYFGLAQLKKFALWHDPLEGDPLRLMQISVAAGIGMISLGLVLNIVNRIRRGDFVGGILDQFGVAGALFYWGGIALLTQQAALQSHGLLIPAIVLFLVAPATGWILLKPIQYALNRRAGKPSEPGGLFAAIAESLVGTFEAFLVYLANTISFVRLAAYAMSHTALLMAIYMLAEQVRHFSQAGGLFGLLIIGLGNLIVILLEGLVGAVQALRLEYYEFFGKFFAGGGRPFRPFCLMKSAN